MKGTHIITTSGPSLQSIRNDAISIAKDIGYSKEVVDKLSKAMGQSEINHILADARHEWDVDPGRWYEYKERPAKKKVQDSPCKEEPELER